ncbi:MAG: DUF2232 domain-containing protein [bacterium]|nr:DUF2232 domain-containing protein [bacterium]
MSYSYRLLAALILSSIVLFWPPFTFFALVPVVLLYCLKGPRYAVGGMLFAALTIWLLSGITLISLMFLLAAGIPALVMGTLIKKEIEAWHTIVLSTVFLLGSLALLIVILERVEQLNFSLEMQRILRDSLDRAYQFYKNRGLSAEDLSLIKRNSWRLLRMLDLIWPSLLIIGIWFFVHLDYVISGRLLRRFGITTNPLPVLNQWRSPEWLVWGFIVPSGILVSDQAFKVSQFHWLYLNLVNILVLVGFVYLVQGLGIASYFFYKAKAGKLPRLLFYLLVALNRELWFALMFFGLLDIWIDFRKRRGNESNNER